MAESETGFSDSMDDLEDHVLCCHFTEKLQLVPPLIKSYRQQKIYFMIEYYFYFLPAKFELAATNSKCTVANLVQPG